MCSEKFSFGKIEDENQSEVSLSAFSFDLRMELCILRSVLVGDLRSARGLSS